MMESPIPPAEMVEGAVDTDSHVVAPSALQSSLRRSMGKAMRRALVTVVGAAAVGTAPLLMLMPGRHDAVIAVATALGIGALCALFAIHSLSTAIAELCSRPVDMLLSQRELTANVPLDGMNWSGGKPLTQSELKADLETLAKVVRSAGRRSRETMAELERAREQANRQNVAKSQFLASMSHELRTPLNAILGYATLLHEDALEAGNDSAATDLDRIQLAGRNLLAVINDILDLAKIESGKSVVERGVVNVAELVDNVVRSCPPESRGGNDLSVDVSGDVGILIGDGAKVRQCLLNLMHNAFKFTPSGRVFLTVQPAFRSAVAGLAFTVEDTGIGIAPRHLDTLFDVFTRVETGPAAQFDGAGLGLAITRRLARMMGGDCTVESEVGSGSSFTLWIPLSPHGQERKPARLPSASTCSAVRPCGKPVALIIDDDEAALDLMRRWLKRNGYDVVGAGDAESGLTLAREQRPDLILLDALLPGRSGYDILPELTADPRLRRTPVILVTIDDDRARGLASGACDYLRKPLSERRLLSMIEPYRAPVSGDVLVIDDDDDSAELIKRSVEQIGFSSRRASDGLQGISMACKQPPAAIVLDIIMPGLNGFDVIERLAENEYLAGIPLIVVSGCEISLPQHRRLEEGGHRFFTKGAATPREIAQSLRELIA